MRQFLRNLKIFIQFQPSSKKVERLNAQEAKQNEEHFKTSAGRKLQTLIDSYVSDCAFGAASKYGDEATYKNGWTMGAMGLRSFIKSQFRQPAAHADTEAEDEDGIPG